MWLAKIAELDSAAWSEWVDSRPESVQGICKKFPPDRLYKMKSTGSRVTLVAYSEDGTVTVDISVEFNRNTFNREVFGVDPGDLEECDLPSK